MRDLRVSAASVAVGDRAKKVYWESHKNLDRDDDGAACGA